MGPAFRRKKKGKRGKPSKQRGKGGGVKLVMGRQISKKTGKRKKTADGGWDGTHFRPFWGEKKGRERKEPASVRIEITTKGSKEKKERYSLKGKTTDKGKKVKFKTVKSRGWSWPKIPRKSRPGKRKGTRGGGSQHGEEGNGANLKT